MKKVSTTQFWKLPVAIHATGASAMARLVYAGILDSSRGRGWTNISQRRIARLLGVCRVTVQRAVLELQQRRLVSVYKGPKGGSHRYELACGGSDSGNLANRTGHGQAVAEVDQRGSDVANGRSHPGVTSQPEVATPVSHTQNRLESRQQQDSQPELAAAFRDAGIERPTDRRLALEFPQATAGLIQEALANVSPRAGVGAKVEILRARLPELLVREDRRAIVRAQLDAVIRACEAEYEQKQQTVEAAITSIHEETWIGPTVRGLIARLGGSYDAAAVVRDWRRQMKLDGKPSAAWRWMLYRTATGNSASAA